MRCTHYGRRARFNERSLLALVFNKTAELAHDKKSLLQVCTSSKSHFRYLYVTNPAHGTLYSRPLLSVVVRLVGDEWTEVIDDQLSLFEDQRRVLHKP